MCTHTTSACVFPFYLPIETDELQPAHMISYSPVTFYLCASSYSNSHGAQIKKKKYTRNKSFSKIRWRRESWHVLVITTHYPQSPIPKSSFIFIVVHTENAARSSCANMATKTKPKAIFFSIFFKQIPIGQCACITYEHTPQISNHIILYYTPCHSISPVSVLYSD